MCPDITENRASHVHFLCLYQTLGSQVQRTCKFVTNTIKSTLSDVL